MNNQRSKRIPSILFGQLFAIAIMALLAFSILYYAEGYRLNWKNFKLAKTGVIYLSSYPKGADVYLDGLMEEKKTPYSKSLLPGFYYVVVKKSGYQDWSASFRINAGFVASYKSIVLFKNQIVPEPLTDQSKINLVNAPTDVLATTSDDRLVINNGYEIWQGSKLVTRFSEPVLGVKMYPDRGHIVFQQANEIRVIDIDGSNNILLVTLKNDSPAAFAVSSNGNELYYNDGGQYFAASIR